MFVWTTMKGPTMFRHLIILIICLFVAVPSWAATYYTDKAGSDANTCAMAATASVDRTKAMKTIGTISPSPSGGMGCLKNPDDVLIVGDGIYVEAERAFGNQSGSPVNGTAGHPVTLKAEHKWLAILSSTSTATCDPGISFSASYITVEDLYVKVDPSAVPCGVYSAANANLLSWEATSPTPANPTTGHPGIVIRGVKTDPNVLRSVGIKIRTDNALVENSDLSDLENFNNTGTIFRNNIIRGLALSKGGARNLQFYNNVVHISDASVSQFGNTNAIVIGGCTCNGCGFDAATHIESYNGAVYNNAVLNDSSNQTYVAFQLRSDADSKVFNNVSVGLNPIAFGVTCASPTPSNANPFVENNIFIGTGATSVPALTQFTGTKTIDYNDFYNFASGVPTQTHAITGNPNLVNNLTDWHPQAGSPVINAGTTITMPAYGGGTITVNVTADGVTRPIGTAWDLGIYSSTRDFVAPAAPLGLKVQ